jgi:hypothetical protein
MRRPKCEIGIELVFGSVGYELDCLQISKKERIQFRSALLL